jgi:hypothetical protein
MLVTSLTYLICLMKCTLSASPFVRCPSSLQLTFQQLSYTHLPIWKPIDSSKTSRSRVCNTVHSANLYQPVRSARHCELSCSCSFCLKMHQNTPKLSQVSPTSIITYGSDIRLRKLTHPQLNHDLSNMTVFKFAKYQNRNCQKMI